MRWAALVVVVCGCNQIFKIQETQLLDGPPAIDAPPAPRCPARGTVPEFRGDLRQLLGTRNCSAYAPSDTRALAYCQPPFEPAVLKTGDVDGDLTTMVTMLPDRAPTVARLAPEGTSFFTIMTDSTTAAQPAIVEYALDAGGTWDMKGQQTLPQAIEVSTPTRGPDRHVVYVEYNVNNWSQVALVELAQTGVTWNEVHRYPIAAISADVTFINAPSLSADGLRLVFIGAIAYTPAMPNTGSGTDLPPTSSGGPTVFYSDRGSLADPFEKFQELTTVPTGVDWPFLTEDCGRIYFSALNTVFYFKQ